MWSSEGPGPALRTGHLRALPVTHGKRDPAQGVLREADLLSIWILLLSRRRPYNDPNVLPLWLCCLETGAHGGSKLHTLMLPIHMHPLADLALRASLAARDSDDIAQ